MQKNILFFIALICLNSIFVSDIHPSYSKPHKERKNSSSTTNAPPKPSENSLSKFAVDYPDIAQAILIAKKYQGTVPVEKSQLETQSQYEARISASQPTNISPVEVIVSAKEKYYYDAEEVNFIVSMEIDSNYNGDNIESLKTGRIYKNESKSNITCTNGYGAKFYYVHTNNELDKYSISYFKQETFENKKDPSWFDMSWSSSGSQPQPISKALLSSRPNSISPTLAPSQQPLVPNPRITIDGTTNPESSTSNQKLSDKYRDYAYQSFDFKLPMNVSDIKRYVTLDEKKLNGTLKFVLTLKPAFPFYTALSSNVQYAISLKRGEQGAGSGEKLYFTI